MAFQVTYLTIFPELFNSFFSTSLIKKAIAEGVINLSAVNVRDFASPPHYKVDDTPYGGGAGMVMLADPVVKAVEEVKKTTPDSKVIALTPSGKRFTQKKAKELSRENSLIFICGRYEGIDARALELCSAEELSIGDYVTMGGEIPSMVITEAVVRLLPSVLGNPESIVEESYSDGDKLEAPHYTKPPVYRGLEVPKALLSGNHKEIKEWKETAGLERKKYRDGE